jgi:hypothetical protein
MNAFLVLLIREPVRVVVVVIMEFQVPERVRLIAARMAYVHVGFLHRYRMKEQPYRVFDRLPHRLYIPGQFMTPNIFFSAGPTSGLVRNFGFGFFTVGFSKFDSTFFMVTL